MTKSVYSFGGDVTEGNAELRDLLGGKGANLAEMATIGLPVPPGFTITTEVCIHYRQHDGAYPDELEAEVDAALADIEETVGAKFGDPANPLLVSVRSGARVSMPGMMDTVLNLGLNEETVAGLAVQSGNERFAWDSYRRFIQMYSDVVLGVEHYLFEEIIEIHKEEKGVMLDTELDAGDWREVALEFKAKTRDVLGRPFPEDVRDQLWGAISAVFGSWNVARAKTYRRLHGISESWGTAVNVQAMVFGNMGPDSATGVAFTRDPSTGENATYGEYLIDAQGEDVVAGIRTPHPLTIASKAATRSKKNAMEEELPEVFGQLAGVFKTLETHYRDMQDVEFTVQRGKLWMLQTRAGKRTASAALKIAVDMVAEGLLSEEEAVLRVDPHALDQLLHPTLDPDAAREVLAKGLPASPGAASGAVVFDADSAEKQAEDGKDVILVRVETSPEDIHGMHAARGILTSRGGMTSHAAVVARGMGRACVAGAGSIQVDLQDQVMRIEGQEIKAGEIITIDGGTGEVMLGAVPTVQPALSSDFDTLMAWADTHRTMGVRTNAETATDVKTALQFGAEGIGLCRTEHMFFDADRIVAVRRMILAEDKDERLAALDELLPMQRSDFIDIFSRMKGLPVTIRLLDPPLHEFLPREDHEFAAVAEAMGLDAERLRRRSAELFEFNPMLGHRGCRLGISYPEIYEMQARAIFEGAIEAEVEIGGGVMPEIMVPLVALEKELSILREKIDTVAEAVFEERDMRIDYQVGTMIELPRAALRAGEIAASADFFSFGTNDLTQTTFGLSRDDSARFLHDYLDQHILERDPFVTIDVSGVGELIRIAVERGRAARPGIKMGICGEHGGDPASVIFCHEAGLDYVSCSPYRVPIARLAAAQAALGKKSS